MTKYQRSKIRKEAWRRAVEGVERPIFYQGELIGAVKEYDNGLLRELLAIAEAERRDRRQYSTVQK